MSQTTKNAIRHISVSMELEALALARRCAPTRRSLGRFLSRLCYEYQARLEGRREALQEAGDGEAESHG